MSPPSKESGTGWLGSVPEEWAVVPAKSLFAQRAEASRPDDVHLTPSQKYGVLPQTEYMAITGGRVVLNLAGSDNMKHVEPGDVISHLRSFQGGLETSDVPGKVSTAYTVLRPRAGVDRGFFRYLFKSERYIQALGATTNQLRDGQSIRYAEFSLIPLPLPPLTEQRAIADYLDRETAKIETLIEKQTTMIERLRERKTAAAERRVLDVDAPRLRLKYLLRQSRAVNPGGVPVLSVYRDYGVILKNSRDDNINVTPENLDRYLWVRPTDLVVNKMKAWQGSLGASSHEGIVSPDYEVLTLSAADIVLPQYLHFILRSPAYAHEFRTRSVGIRPIQWRLYWDQLGQVEIPIPGLAEQERIVTLARESEQMFDTLIAKVERHIELAKERRAALITAAVTGQIDVMNPTKSGEPA